MFSLTLNLLGRKFPFNISMLNFIRTLRIITLNTFLQLERQLENTP